MPGRNARITPFVHPPETGLESAAEPAILARMIWQKIRSLLDPYGATEPAEFFAVATETFFEKPRQLHKKHPELYAEMMEFYGMDPKEWFARPAGA